MNLENQNIINASFSDKYSQNIEELKILLNHATDFNSSIKEALKIVCNSLCGEVGTFWVYNQNGDGLIHAKETFGNYSLDNITLLPGEGIAGQCIETTKPIFVYNCQKDDRWAQRVDEKTSFLTKSIICAPLVYQGIAFACIQIVNKNVNDFFDDNDMDFLESLSNIIVEGYIKRNLINQNMLSSSRHQIDMLNGKIIDAAAMYVIINNFDRLLSVIDIKKAVNVVNSLLVYIGTIVDCNGGFIDKCIGDSAIAVFDKDAYAVNAIKSAIEIMNNKDDLLNKISKAYNVDLGFSIGISSGRSYIGGINDKGIADHTVLGESIINASLLGSKAQYNEILVSQELAKELNGKEFKFEKVVNCDSSINPSIEAYYLVKQI